MQHEQRATDTPDADLDGTWLAPFRFDDPQPPFVGFVAVDDPESITEPWVDLEPAVDDADGFFFADGNGYSLIPLLAEVVLFEVELLTARRNPK